MSEDSDLLYKVPGKCAIVYLFRDCYQCFEGEGTVSRPEAYAHSKLDESRPLLWHHIPIELLPSQTSYAEAEMEV